MLRRRKIVALSARSVTKICQSTMLLCKLKVELRDSVLKPEMLQYHKSIKCMEALNDRCVSPEVAGKKLHQDVASWVRQTPAWCRPRRRGQRGGSDGTGPCP